jgi:hypothetical protein
MIWRLFELESGEDLEILAWLWLCALEHCLQYNTIDIWIGSIRGESWLPRDLACQRH